MTTWQNKQTSLGGAIVLSAIFFVIGVFAGLNWSAISGTFGSYFGFQGAPDINLSEVNELYHTLQQEFDGELSQPKLIEGAKRGLVDALGDKYTVFMNATEAEEYNRLLTGDIGAGIGIEMGEREGFVKVLRVLDNNPAKRAGILAGDVIYKVNGEDVSMLTAEEVSAKIRGEVGTEVTVTIVRDRQDELSFTMAREQINNESVFVDYRDDVAIITIRRFDNNTGTLARAAADEINNRGINKVILDLRNNGGGFVNTAVDVVSLWVDGGLALDQRSRSGRNNQTYYANRGQATLAGKKTIVLINDSTASASEIVAGALEDHGVATTVGIKTFGKGVVQTILGLQRGNKLKVTIASWFTPNGNSINKEGIHPDIEVERTFDDINSDRDPQLDRALSELRR
jgi:carboxyl-terminal processing protease